MRCHRLDRYRRRAVDLYIFGSTDRQDILRRRGAGSRAGCAFRAIARSTPIISGILGSMMARSNSSGLSFHEPLFPAVPFHGLDRHPCMSDRLHELFVENGVSLVVAGHDHVYDRKEKDGVTYVIDGRTGGRPVPGGSGSGHSLCYTIATRMKNSYSFAVRGKDGEAVDRFSINRQATGRARPSISDRKSDLP